MKSANVKIIGLYIFLLITFSLFFIFLFHTPIFISVDVFFYRGILLLFTSCILLCLFIGLYIKKTRNPVFTHKDMIFLSVMFFSLNLAFFILVPVTVERSVSVFLLSSFYDKNEFTKLEITERFQRKYVLENDAIKKRLHEQIVSGNIREEHGEYIITENGFLTVKFFYFISKLFSVSTKNILTLD